MGFLDKAKAQGKAGGAASGGKLAGAGKPATPPKQSPRAGRYSTLGAAAPRNQRLRDGRYQVKVIKTCDFDGRKHDFFNIELEIVQAADDSAQKPGQKVLVQYMVDKGDCFDMNGPKVVSFIMTALGFATEEEFNEQFPENSEARDVMMNRCAGVELDETEIGENPLAGMLLMVQAAGNGRDAGDGTEYQDYAWAVNEEG